LAISVGVANVSCKRCAATNNMCGFTVAGGSIALDGCASTYNTLRGLYAEGGGHFTATQEPTFIGASGEMGICLANNSSMAVQAGIPQGYVLNEANDAYGIWLTSGGTLSFSNTLCAFYAYDNGLLQTSKYDVYVTNFGLVNSSGCVTGSRIFNATPGVMRSDGGLIN
jgi:hypothetical protein